MNEATEAARSLRRPTRDVEPSSSHWGRSYRAGSRAALAACALLASAVVLSSCSSGAVRANVAVDIGPSALHLSPTTYTRHGGVTFNVDNRSGQYRNLLIVRFNHVSALPLTPAGAVDLSRISLADQIDVLAPGRYHFLSPDLVPGTYMFVSSQVALAPGPPVIVGNQSYAARITATGPYQPAMAVRFQVQ